MMKKGLILWLAAGFAGALLANSLPEDLAVRKSVRELNGFAGGKADIVAVGSKKYLEFAPGSAAVSFQTPSWLKSGTGTLSFSFIPNFPGVIPGGRQVKVNYLFCSRGKAGTLGVVLNQYADGNTNLLFIFTPAGKKSISAQRSVAIANGREYKVLLSWDKTEATLFLNGKFMDSVLLSDPLVWGDKVNIGGFGGELYRFDGKISPLTFTEDVIRRPLTVPEAELAQPVKALPGFIDGKAGIKEVGGRTFFDFTGNVTPMIFRTPQWLKKESGSLSFYVIPEFPAALPKGKSVLVHYLFYSAGKDGAVCAAINQYPDGHKNLLFMYTPKGKKGVAAQKMVSIEEGKIHRIKTAWDRNFLAVYLNGKLVATAKTDVPLSWGEQLRLGALGGTLYRFDGKISRLEFLPDGPGVREELTIVKHRGKTASARLVEDLPDSFTCELRASDAAGVLTVAPRNLKISAGQKYWIERSEAVCKEVVAEKDGILQIPFDDVLNDWINILPTNGNILPQGNWEYGVLTRDFPRNPNRLTGISAASALDSFVRKGEVPVKDLTISPQPNGDAAAAFSPWISSNSGESYLITAKYVIDKKPFAAGTHFGVQFEDHKQQRTPLLGWSYVSASTEKDPFVLTLRITIPKNVHKFRLFTVAAGEMHTAKWVEFDVREPLKFIRKQQFDLTPEQMAASKLKPFDRTPVLSSKKINGRVVLHLNGKPIPYFALNSFPNARGCRIFADAGVNFQYMMVYSKWHPWIGKDKYDFTQLDNLIKSAYEQAPQAPLLLYFSMTPYRDFAKDFPRSGVRGVTNKYTDWRFKETGNNPAGAMVSYASKDYYRELEKMIRAVAEHLQNNPYAKNLAGFHVVGGNDGQWFAPRYDQSPDAVDSFREYLKKVYNHDLAAFRKAWGDDTLEFDTVPMKPYSNYGNTPLLNPDDPADRPQIDFLKWRMQIATPLLIMAAKTLRESFKRPLWLTMYYPDVMSGGDAGKEDMAFFLKNDLYDGFVSCIPYGEHRRLGSMGGINQVTGSAELYGKLTKGEMDYRGDYTAYNGRGYGADFNALGAAHGHEGIYAQSIRDLGIRLTQGQGTWCYIMAGVAWADEEFKEQLRDLRNAAALSAGNPNGGDRPALKVIIDPDTTAYNRKAYWHYPILYSTRLVQEALFASGLGFETYMLDDLDHPEFPRGKIYYFPLASHISVKQIEFIKKHLQKDGNVLIFSFDAGRLSGLGTEKAVKELTGIAIADGKKYIHYRNSFEKSPCKELVHGNNDFRTWMFHVTDESAEVLCRFHSEPDKVSAAMKKHGNWTGIYIAAPSVITPAFLNKIAKEAGVTPVCDSGDVIADGNNYVVIHASNSGRKVLRFAKNTTLIDPVSGKVLAKDVKEYEFEMKLGESRWFYKK